MSLEHYNSLDSTKSRVVAQGLKSPCLSGNLPWQGQSVSHVDSIHLETFKKQAKTTASQCALKILCKLDPSCRPIPSSAGSFIADSTHSSHPVRSQQRHSKNSRTQKLSMLLALTELRAETKDCRTFPCRTHPKLRNKTDHFFFQSKFDNI